MMTETYAIIAGANKAGTTSLFRYLAAHPEVCSSNIKETDFFLQHGAGNEADVRRQYDALFPRCGGEQHVKLEASPAYLTEGAGTAQRIKQVLPDVKLVFCLREPVRRILSYYQRSRQSRFHEGLAALDPWEFVELLERVVADPGSVPAEGVTRNALIQYTRGCYTERLRVYGELFRREHVHIVMFDSMVDRTRETVREVAEFIGVSPEFYDDYQFRIENKTQAYRFPVLQSRGARLSKKLEGTLNKFPFVRQFLRRILLTSKNQGKPVIGKDLFVRISELYLDELDELSRYLCIEYPDLALPSWLPCPSDRGVNVTSESKESLLVSDAK